LQVRRHNYIASLIEHGADLKARKWLQESYPGTVDQFFKEFPDLMATSEVIAWKYLKDGLSCLFAPEHQAFVLPAGRFIARRIGFERSTATVSGTK
jgi:hypothetical protein